MTLQASFLLRWLEIGTKVGPASAEDRALRGRNLSADRSLANGRSGRCLAARLAPAGARTKATNPSIHSSDSSLSTALSPFDRTQKSPFESYTTARAHFDGTTIILRTRVRPNAGSGVLA